KVSPDLIAEWKPAYPLLTTAAANLFNLVVRDMATGLTEEYRNVTALDSPREISKILKARSALVRVDGAAATFPTGTHGDPDPGEDIWADNTLSTKVGTDATDGDALNQASFTGTGLEVAKEGLYALDKA